MASDPGAPGDLLLGGRVLGIGSAVWAPRTMSTQARNRVHGRRDREALAEDARRIFDAGVAAADPRAAVGRALTVSGDVLVVADVGGARHHVDLTGFDEVVVVGGGKAGAAMAAGVEDALGERVDGGVVVIKHGHLGPTLRVELIEAGHPLPDAAGVVATERLLRVVAQAGPRSLILCVISGGASSLLVSPPQGVSLDDLRALTDGLLGAGADIRAINTVRKHVSRVKGGQLARLATPATLVTLVLSDVIGDPLSDIASGPTVEDATTFDDAREVLRRFHLWGDGDERDRAAEARLPEAVKRHLLAGIAGEFPETPTTDDPGMGGAVCVVVANNRAAIEGCRGAAETLGWGTLILASTIEGEARSVARVLAAIGREVREVGQPLAPPLCVISGGEPTVTLDSGALGLGSGLGPGLGSKPGRGGRNQELALAAALAIEGIEGVAIFACGTDGTDGPTDAAGAVAFGDSVALAAAAGFDAREHLDGHDAYPLFEAIGDLIKTGPTGTNVMDLHLILVAPGDRPEGHEGGR